MAKNAIRGVLIYLIFEAIVIQHKKLYCFGDQNLVDTLALYVILGLWKMYIKLPRRIKSKRIISNPVKGEELVIEKVSPDGGAVLFRKSSPEEFQFLCLEFPSFNNDVRTLKRISFPNELDIEKCLF